MSTRRVLDSFAVIAYLEGEPGADQVGDLIRKARDRDEKLLLSLINWGEVYYITKRAGGQDVADRALVQLDTLPIDVIFPDREVTRSAADMKATRKLSYADCFAAALAKVRNAELVTGDKEFKVVQADLKGIMWLESK